MSSKEEDELVLKLLTRNIRDVSAIFGVINDFAVLIEEKLERCARVGCLDAATVNHKVFGLRMCDACAATIIVKSNRNITVNQHDDLNLVRTLTANEELWTDLPHAVRIRRLADYVSLLQGRYEPDPPEHLDQMH